MNHNHGNRPNSLKPAPSADYLDKYFWPRVQKAGADACWPWTGKVNKTGYGHFSFNPTGLLTVSWMAHRLAYKTLGPGIPDGLTLDHLCKNKRCCNPAHLEPVTSSENSSRATAASGQRPLRLVCKHGHPLTSENVRMNCGKRKCRKCVARRDREKRARIRLQKLADNQQNQVRP